MNRKINANLEDKKHINWNGLGIFQRKKPIESLFHRKAISPNVNFIEWKFHQMPIWIKKYSRRKKKGTEEEKKGRRK
jgi:hypothetical protein